MRRLLTLACLTAFACGVRNSDGGDAPGVPVETAVVRRDTITDQVALVGRLAPVPGGSALLTAPAGGMVRALSAQVGAWVRAGTVLVEVEVPELAASAAQLRVAAEVAEQDAQRQAALLAAGVASRKDAQARAADAARARAEAEAAEQLLARTQVRSPIDGSVQRVKVNIGEWVDLGAPMVEVINSATLDLLATAPAADLARLRPGQQATVQAEGVPGLLTGRVQAVAPAVDSLTNAGTVVIRLVNVGRLFRAGSGATARVSLGLRRDVLIVPDSALVLVGDVMSVFVVSPDSTVHARAVKVGVRQGGRVEVEGKLEAGDLLATAGAYGLTDGMRVAPRTPGVE